MNARVEFTKPAHEQLRRIKDKRVRDHLFERVEALANDPENQGKPLRNDLSGFRCVRAIGQRYRIIYRVEREKGVLGVIALGIRKEGQLADIYTLPLNLIPPGH